MRCRQVTTLDGTPVRVQAPRPLTDADHAALQEVVDAARVYLSTRCGHEGPHPMPERVQAREGRVGYTCGRDAGHDGRHRWPDRDTPHTLEWE